MGLRLTPDPIARNKHRCKISPYSWILHLANRTYQCSDFVKNLFWTVYAQDKVSRKQNSSTLASCIGLGIFTLRQLWSMAVGRFTNITQDDHNIAVPEVDAAYDQIPWTAPRIWQDVDANGLTLANGRPGYVSTCFQATIKLAAIQNSVLRKL
jgi:hypothetical protein